MIAYRPQQSNPSRLPISPKLGVLMAVALIGGLFVVSLIAQATNTAYKKKLISNEDVIYPVYKERVARQTNVAKLAQTADNLTKQKLYRYAALNFKQAFSLDPHYRDMAYGWAYAILNDKKSNLTQGDLAEIRDAIKGAESVDPLYPPLLDLKALVARLTGNETEKALAESRQKLIRQ